MRRIPIQLDEETYKALKRRAFEENRSIASLVRESVARMLTPGIRSIEDFSFVASGRAANRPAVPVSEDHDRALADAIRPKRK